MLFYIHFQEVSFMIQVYVLYSVHTFKSMYSESFRMNHSVHRTNHESVVLSNNCESYENKLFLEEKFNVS